MTMGERIRRARIESGLSQRQLAGDVMTRNMLSALEHDGANPSLGTLKYLSEKLCKPISYFFGEEERKLPGLAEMERARMFFDRKDYSGCLKELENLQQPILEREQSLLQSLCLLELARQAREDGRIPFSARLLTDCRRVLQTCPYLREELERSWLIASARIAENKAAIVAQLPSEDEVLLLRAQAAIEQGQYDRAACLLEAAQDRNAMQWNFLRGEVYFCKRDYHEAVQCYHRAEEAEPEKTAGRLEVCYRELEDYKMAYYYAKKGQ